MSVLIDVATVVLFLIVIGTSIALAVRRGLFATILHIAGLLVATVAAVVLTPPVMKLFEGSLAKAGANAVNSSEGFLAQNSVIEEAVKGIPAAVLRPFVFVAVFFLVKIIIDIVVFFTCNNGRGDLIEFKGQKAVAAVLGVIIACVCLWMFEMPVMGTIRTGAQIVKWGAGNADKIGAVSGVGMPKDILDFASDAGDSNMLKLTDGTLKGGVLYNKLATVEAGGEKASLPEELPVLLRIADDLMAAAGKSEQQQSGSQEGGGTQKTGDAIRDIAEALGQSVIGSAAVKEEIGKAVEQWKKGDEYLGILVKTDDEATNELADAFVDCIGDAPPEKVADVLNFIADVADVAEGGAGGDGKEALKDIFSKMDVNTVVDILDTAYHNESMKPFSDAMVKWFLKRAADALEVNADDEIAKVSVANATEEEFKDLTDKLVSAFATAESFSDKLYTGEELTEEEENKLNEAISTLESNLIVGRAVKKIADEADKKYGGE